MSSEALARSVRERCGLDVRVPRWREVLRLEPGEEVAVTPLEPVSVDFRATVLALTAELEADIAQLRKQLAASEAEISDEDVQKLRDIREELRALVSG